MSSRIRYLFAALIVVCLPTAFVCQGQQADDEDVQSFNDIQLSIPVHAKVDLALTTTLRFGENLSRLNEGRVGIGVGIKLNKALTVSSGYNYIEARNSSGRFTTEHRYHLNGVYKFPVKAFGLYHRSQYEYRVRASGNSWRYRPSLTFEKALPEKLLSRAKFFITEEPFYVSTSRRFSRNRLSVGIKKAVNDHFTFDIYYLRQNDGTTRPGDLNVIGTSWKFNL